MFQRPTLESLQADHLPDAIQHRLSQAPRHSYLGDAVLGAMDGCVTTFAIISGSMGGGFSSKTALVLGFANLVADGFSMAVGNYHNTKSQRDQVAFARSEEEYHIDHFPEGEKEELRQIFAMKGLEGEVLEKVVEVISRDRELWINTMLTEEFGLQIETPSPWRSALVTFGAFLTVGFLPLLPFCLPMLPTSYVFPLSALLTFLGFFGVGWGKGHLLRHSRWSSGWTTLWTGERQPCWLMWLENFLIETLFNFLFHKNEFTVTGYFADPLSHGRVFCTLGYHGSA